MVMLGRSDGVSSPPLSQQFNCTTNTNKTLSKQDKLLMLTPTQVLNPAGIRFGSAEIYNILLHHYPSQISDALCIGRKLPHDLDEIVVLFLKMSPNTPLTPDLITNIKATIRNELSARHVPSVVDECPDIPVTVNGKKIENAVKQIVSGSKIKTSASVANPECLEFFQRWAETH